MSYLFNVCFYFSQIYIYFLLFTYDMTFIRIMYLKQIVTDAIFFSLLCFQYFYRANEDDHFEQDHFISLWSPSSMLKINGNWSICCYNGLCLTLIASCFPCVETANMLLASIWQRSKSPHYIKFLCLCSPSVM